jgi:hypothetical protein
MQAGFGPAGPGPHTRTARAAGSRAGAEARHPPDGRWRKCCVVPGPAWAGCMQAPRGSSWDARAHAQRAPIRCDTLADPTQGRRLHDGVSGGKFTLVARAQQSEVAARRQRRRACAVKRQREKMADRGKGPWCFLGGAEAGPGGRVGRGPARLSLHGVLDYTSCRPGAERSGARGVHSKGGAKGGHGGHEQKRQIERWRLGGGCPKPKAGCQGRLGAALRRGTNSGGLVARPNKPSAVRAARLQGRRLGRPHTLQARSVAALQQGGGEGDCDTSWGPCCWQFTRGARNACTKGAQGVGRRRTRTRRKQDGQPFALAGGSSLPP